MALAPWLVVFSGVQHWALGVEGRRRANSLGGVLKEVPVPRLQQGGACRGGWQSVLGPRLCICTQAEPLRCAEVGAECKGCRGLFQPKQ